MTLDSSGVTVSGPMVKMNSSGGPGSGSAAAAKASSLPQAMTAVGEKNAPTVSLMSMDAANYINTLDSLALTETSPKAPQFAIVDLAVDDGFLGQLYGGMKHAAIDWFSLFTGSAWQPD